jgi:hypothetical protein
MATIGHPELGVVESSHAKLFEAIQLVGQKNAECLKAKDEHWETLFNSQAARIENRMIVR